MGKAEGCPHNHQLRKAKRESEMNKSLARMFELGIRAQFDTELAPPIVIIGRSGIGKTASTNAIGSALKRPVFGFEMAGKRPEDITGYAYADLEKGVMKFLPNEMVRSILNSKNSIVFFDEICDLDRMMQQCTVSFVESSLGTTPPQKEPLSAEPGIPRRSLRLAVLWQSLSFPVSANWMPNWMQ